MARYEDKKVPVEKQAFYTQVIDFIEGEGESAFFRGKAQGEQSSFERGLYIAALYLWTKLSANEVAEVVEVSESAVVHHLNNVVGEIDASTLTLKRIRRLQDLRNRFNGLQAKFLITELPNVTI